jgi:outer membrane protein assembly factor BamC
MKPRHFCIYFCAAIALSACSTDSQRIDYKATSTRTPKLETPPDLSAPTAGEQFAIPGGDAAVVASFSSYAQSVSGAVLPALSSVRLEKNATERWLVVQESAEHVWPKLKAFWLAMGFQVKIDNAAAGVLETDWQENTANAPQQYLHSSAGNGKALNRLFPAGQRDQYLTRLERNADGSTSIYLRRQVMQQALNGASQLIWLPYANDPAIEAAVLQMLMAELTSLPSKPLPSASAVIAPVEVLAAKPEWLQLADRKVIRLNEAFDKTWRKVDLALDKARLAIEDRDRSKGVYLLRASVLPDGKKAPSYQVTLKDNGASCDVSVSNINGATDLESQRLLEVLYQNIDL